MKEWKTYRIGDICKTNSSQYSTKEAWDEFLYLDTGNITRNIIEDIVRYSSAAELPSRARRKVVNDDIIFSTVRPNQCHFGILSNPPANLLVSTGFTVITANKEIVDPYYLYYYLTQDSIVDYLHSIGEQAVSAYPSIKAQDIEDIEIELPDLSTQNNIAKTLRALDNKIQLNRQINDNLEQQAQALYKSWFLDFEPFRDGNFVESELGLIPEGWKVRDIYKYTDVIYGAPYKSSLFNENKEGYPLIRIRDLKSFAPQFYTQEILPQTEYVIAGDVVAGMDAEFTPYIWQGEKGVLNQRCCKFKGQYPWVSNYYLLNLLKPELEYVQSYKTGTTVSHLGKADIDRFKVITPPESIVKSFSVIVNSLLEQKIKSAYEIRNLTSTRDSLLPKLMSGELKINEIDC